jgi:4-hydroxy-tetrahydrodipicolinate synthase
MPRFRDFEPTGVIPACLLPFNDDLSIDDASYRRHVAHVAAVPGISAITVNAHASEVASCNFEEQARVLDLTMAEIGDKLPVVHGVYADGSLEAARIARMATAGGASALLVFPPGPFTMGQRTEMAIAHFQRIAEASDLPLIAFQYPLAGGQGYPIDTLLRMITAVPSIRAIKDWCNSVPQHEAHIRLLHALSRPVKVLTTHSAWLLSSLVLGCDGLLSGMGSVAADLQAALYQAVRDGNLNRAQAINERIRPLAEVFYETPAVDMHNRMKEALVVSGPSPRGGVRPPLVKLGSDEVARIARAVSRAGLTAAGARLEAA